MNTILGASGFIGHYLAQILDKPFCPTRDELYLLNGNLGHVYYCIGDDSGAIEPNLGYLLWFLKNCRFESLVYLSSTRVYLGASSGDEDAVLKVSPEDPGCTFNIMKLAAEEACFQLSSRCKVVRLSTVVGLNNGSYLIPGLIRSAWQGAMDLYLPPKFARDFIAIEDVAELLPKIREGRTGYYNIASGSGTTMLDLVSAIDAVTKTKRITWHNGKWPDTFPPISIKRVQEEFGFSPRPVLPMIPELCRQYQDVYVRQVMFL